MFLGFASGIVVSGSVNPFGTKPPVCFFRERLGFCRESGNQIMQVLCEAILIQNSFLGSICCAIIR
jgi:hypothetical protein